MNYSKLIIHSIIAGSAYISAVSSAINMNDSDKATSIIKDMAETICGQMIYDGRKHSESLSAEATAKVNNLLRQIADVGGVINGNISQSGYYGVLQEQLGTTIKDNQDCREHIWNDLKGTLTHPVTLPSEEPIICSSVMIDSSGNQVNVSCTK
ncbi:hypothetical protein [Pantoea cypripedii]|uniref:Uncharacterized protein n=1 Tax=Pantoea cypripedii TaxID=55209 RepID=A0A6B9G4R0_PANCY|nr:hypothetical protein [Pantoea cypripedii]QGY32504.1 hypothetical protein CUN67_26430 [Pantoea cypripedii]